ncbi:hypothetical protein F5146DRAFT_490358 [Armillaria mellea]|nr:hypothetical protein F5146DRAFT_490358 [Armillaria mellea]
MHMFLLFHGVLRHACRLGSVVSTEDRTAGFGNPSFQCLSNCARDLGIIQGSARGPPVLEGCSFTKGEFHECANVKCPNGTDKLPPPMRRCRGYLNAFYCSRDCQRMEWHAHKKDCQNVQREPRVLIGNERDFRPRYLVEICILSDSWPCRTSKATLTMSEMLWPRVFPPSTRLSLPITPLRQKYNNRTHAP